MKHFAIFEGAMTPNHTNTVREVVPETVTVDGITHGLRDRYHGALIATMRKCPEGTQPGDEYDIIADTYNTPAATMDTDTGNGEPPPKDGQGDGG